VRSYSAQRPCFCEKGVRKRQATKRHTRPVDLATRFREVIDLRRKVARKKARDHPSIVPDRRGSRTSASACESMVLPLPTIGNKAETNDANQQHGPAGRRRGSGNTDPGSVIKTKPFAATHRLIESELDIMEPGSKLDVDQLVSTPAPPRDQRTTG
jgi:hypothetical protein